MGSDSGQTVDGSIDDDGAPEWADPVEPADGATIAGLAVDDAPSDSEPTVLGADESQNAFRSTGFDGPWETFGVGEGCTIFERRAEF